MPGRLDRFAAGRAGIDGNTRDGRALRVLGPFGLEAKPFLQARAAKGMKTVDKRQRLVEEISADLADVSNEARIQNAPPVAILTEHVNSLSRSFGLGASIRAASLLQPRCTTKRRGEAEDRRREAESSHEWRGSACDGPTTGSFQAKSRAGRHPCDASHPANEYEHRPAALH